MRLKGAGLIELCRWWQAVSEIPERNRERDLAEVWGVLTQAPADVRRLRLWVRALRLRARRYARLREKFEVERWPEAICVVAPSRAATRGGIHMEETQEKLWMRP
jgi:hypothetical protein